ncbi:hypothetical protein BC940DRAFT_57999 [Gongronella butleri]|nr:hypothetical protein BC940DRAFT_57999 [Gongronella butleri]
MARKKLFACLFPFDCGSWPPPPPAMGVQPSLRVHAMLCIMRNASLMAMWFLTRLILSFFMGVGEPRLLFLSLSIPPHMSFYPHANRPYYGYSVPYGKDMSGSKIHNYRRPFYPYKNTYPNFTPYYDYYYEPNQIYRLLSRIRFGTGSYYSNPYSHTRVTFAPDGTRIWPEANYLSSVKDLWKSVDPYH